MMLALNPISKRLLFSMNKRQELHSTCFLSTKCAHIVFNGDTNCVFIICMFISILDFFQFTHSVCHMSVDTANTVTAVSPYRNCCIVTWKESLIDSSPKYIVQNLYKLTSRAGFVFFMCLSVIPNSMIIKMNTVT